MNIDLVSREASPLSALAAALSLTVHHPRPPITPYIIFRGPLMSFHHKLDECHVAHGVTVDPDIGMGVTIAGLVVETGGMGGVLVREAG